MFIRGSLVFGRGVAALCNPWFHIIVSKVIRVLGVDTSLRSTGVGVVDAVGSNYKAVTWGTIKNPAARAHTACLAHLFEQVREIIQRDKPEAAAVEGIFFSKNVRTAVTLGQARGVVLAVCALERVPVFEYSPRSVKQSVVGNGNAHKEQVARMVMVLLGLKEEPKEDAADALAMALCHLHHHGRPELSKSKAI